MTTCKLRFEWTGPLPRVGHFLKSRRGRTAYEIVEIDAPQPNRGTFKVCRWPANDLPPHAVVHDWVWDGR